MPFMSGISRSSRIRSKRSASRMAKASRPEAATTTSWPSWTSRRHKRSRLLSLSSTTRMRPHLGGLRRLAGGAERPQEADDGRIGCRLGRPSPVQRWQIAPAEVDDRVDAVEQLSRLDEQPFEVGADRLGARPAVQVLEHHLAVADDGVERRAQIVPELRLEADRCLPVRSPRRSLRLRDACRPGRSACAPRSAPCRRCGSTSSRPSRCASSTMIS